MLLDMQFNVNDLYAKCLQLEPEPGSDKSFVHMAWKSHVLLSKLAAHKHYFTDYTKGCDGECKGFCMDLAPGCKTVKHRVARSLLAKDALVWEVWRGDSEVDFVGILRLSEIEPGCTAKAHYMFFDSDLKGKTAFLQAWKQWVFDNLKLRRVTIEVPSNAFILAKHAVKHLGFGGDFEYNGLPVEGVLRSAKVLDGKPLDLIILGCIK